MQVCATNALFCRDLSPAMKIRIFWQKNFSKVLYVDTNIVETTIYYGFEDISWMWNNQLAFVSGHLNISSNNDVKRDENIKCAIKGFTADSF